jgi:putative membrane protein insertion efficiency factor
MRRRLTTPASGRAGLPARPSAPLAEDARIRDGALVRAPAYLGVGLVYAWRWSFGLLSRGSCKYHPTCSQYALDALKEYGLVRGSLLAGWRLLRCNPWSRGGVDYAHDQRLFR